VCEELVQEVDVNKAFRELQDLHKIWKRTLDLYPEKKEIQSGISLVI
jgi:hypothetical protein